MNVMSPTLQKKVCVLGGFSVGKTSLIRRYVQSIFSETYITTVGVKIDKKMLDLAGRLVTLILWDMAGEDDTGSLRMTYLRGASAYLLVADGTRPATLEVAQSLRERVESACGQLPFALLVNKHDLSAEWAISGADLDKLREQGWWVRVSSARTGEGVEDAFKDLAARVTR